MPLALTLPPREPRSLAIGEFALRRVDPHADLDLIHHWMNDPAVAAYWDLDGPRERTETHLRRQTALDYSAPYLGLLDGEPMSYWEIYRADLDPLLGGRYPARGHDAGLHLLIGPPELRGRNIGSTLLRDMAERALAADPRATRVLAGPDVRNTASIRAFARAGFEQHSVMGLADRRAALMVRPRTAESRPAERPPLQTTHIPRHAKLGLSDVRNGVMATGEPHDTTACLLSGAPRRA